ncbi:MAG: hypothetical protein AAF742_06610 [Pseudomonadota bacterium]
MLKQSVLATALAFGTATYSSAATILFDFEENLSDNSTTQSYSVAGLNLTVGSVGGNINRGGRGLGVSGTPEGGRLGDGETLTFSFDQPIFSVTARIFESGPEDEDFRFSGFGSTTDYIAEGGGPAYTTITINSGTGVNSILFQGLEPNAGGNRGVRIGSLEVRLTPIPLPASGVLLGIAALGLVGRNKRQGS